MNSTVDAAGNIYFSDNSRIRRLGPDGVITTIAGNGVWGTSGDGGAALAASIGTVQQVALYGSRLCFGDITAHKIRCVDLSSGLIQGYGTGAVGRDGDGGNVSAASFSSPVGIAFDDAGNLFVSDREMENVRRIDAVTSVITTIAGPGPGYCCAPVGDGGPAVGANIYQPQGIFYRNGKLYIADQGNDRVRVVDLTSGIISTVAGNGTPWDTGGNADGGLALLAGILPSAVVVDPSGNLFISTEGVVRMVDTTGVITTVAGIKGTSGYASYDVPATETPFGGISGLGWDPVAKRLLISNQGTRLHQIFYTPPTTTTLFLTPNPVVPSGQISLTATVSPVTATGSIRFYMSATLLGSVAVVNGVASLTCAATGGGYPSYPYRAIYGGDANDNLSQSNIIAEIVQMGPSTTTVTSSANPSTQGQNVVFTVTVTPNSPPGVGSVYLYSGPMTIGYGTTSNGTATFNVATLAVGSNSIVAQFMGNASYLSSVSAPLTQVVRTASSTGLSVSANPAAYGAAVTLTATATPAAATGSVQFFNGATPLGAANLVSGQAQLSLANLPVGSLSLTAVYAGDTAYAGSTSAAVAETITKASSSVTLTSSLNPSPNGQSVTFTATISPNSATGTVQFQDGSTVLGTVTISGGSALLALSSLPIGDHSIAAGYSGDANTAASTYTVLTQTISKPPAKVTLTSSPNPAIEGQTVTLTAAVSPTTATGLVQFFEGGSALLGTVTISNGTATLVLAPQTYAFSVGTHAINAVYCSDANNDVGTSNILTQTIVKKTATSVTLASSLNPSTYGQGVTFTARVSPSAATGTVLFVDGSVSFGTAVITGGTASITIATLPPDTHSIFVVYSGDVNYATSTSDPLTQTISKTATKVVLTSSPNPATAGQTVTLTAVVTPGTATGLVQFFEGGSALLGTVTVTGGTTTLTLTPQIYAFPVGTHSINAVYCSDANNAVGTSAVLTQTVNKATSSVALASSLNPSTNGQSVTFTATVTPSWATGTVQFVDGSTSLGTVTVSGGSAALSLSSLSVGAHSIRANYSGDANDTASASSVLSQTVSAALPGAPSNLTATAASTTQINLSWTASATSGVTYNVYSAATSGFTPSASNRIATGVTATSYANSGLAASTTRYYLVTARNSVGESPASNQATATTAAPSVSCHVNYTVTTQWNVGFGTAITIQNTGNTPINGWNLTWTWANHQQITQAWNSDYTQSGTSAKLTNASWNAALAAGATISGIGFNASYTGTNTAPTAFYLNGTLCR